MNAKSVLILMLVILISSFTFPSAALADGIIVPDPIPCVNPPCPGPIPIEQLDIRYHHVQVTIKDQVVVTHVDQVFYNPNNWQIEGTYIFPIPVDAVVTDFILWVDGEPVKGQVLEANQARQVYQDIVNTLRDPALLEYVGRGAVQARIFPIPPQGERRVELEYSQVLTAENGLVQYVYPLSTEKFSLSPLESVSVNVVIESQSPIRAVYSPSHDVAVVRESDHRVKVGYEASNVLPDTDFALYYSIGESEAFHILTYRDASDPSDPDGFFLLLLAPRLGTTDVVIPKDVIIVLDQSGSMDGEKFKQAQQALHYILEHLNRQDRFNIISFSTDTTAYAEGLQAASEAPAARRWVDTLSAYGSTDINRALLEAAALVEQTSGEALGRPVYLIFLTDGLPTEGEVESQNILDNFKAAAPENLRLFGFGLGYDVDTFLLDSLALENHGASSYVLPDEALDEKVSGFYNKIKTPVLTNLSLDFGGLTVYDLYPNPLPDLFSGSQIVAVGRYKTGGNVDVTLNGEFNNEPRAFIFRDQSFEQQSRSDSTQSVIPRLWATRKIGYLLNQIRLKGPDKETIDQIVRLSIRYGIVTPYTSYLVTEEMALGSEAQEQIVEKEYSQLSQATEAPVSGQDAVIRAAEQGGMGGANTASAPPAEAVNQVKIIGARTFVWTNLSWVDTAFDPDQMQTIKLAFLSPDYFTVINNYPDIAAAFALGERVIAISGGVAYEVLPAGEEAVPLATQLATYPVQPTITPFPNQGATQPEPTDSGSITDEPQPPSSNSPEPTSTGQPAEKPEPGSPVCGASLFPLLLIPFGLILFRRQKN